MSKKLKEEMKLTFWRRLTGRQDPSLKRKIASIIIAILIFLINIFIGAIATYFLNDYLTKPTANVVFHPFVINGEYLPIEITNGPRYLEDVELKIKTCYMEDFVSTPKVDLTPYQAYPFHLTNEETIYALDKLFTSEDFICNPQNISSEFHCNIRTYVVNDKLYVPSQECKDYKCDFCPYEMILSSDKFSQNFSGKFPGPVEVESYKIRVDPEKEIDIKEEDMIFYSSFGIKFFSSYEMCLIENNNNLDMCKNIPKDLLLSSPIEVILSPTNESLGNPVIKLTQII